MLDTGAAGVFTAGISQVLALQKLDPIVVINKSTAGKHKICFSKRKAVLLGTIQVITPADNI
jgi:hypothetical protein